MARWILRSLLLALVTVGIVLPIGITILLAVAEFLRAVDDASAARAVGWIAWGGALIWIVDLVCLVGVTALIVLMREQQRDHDPIEER